MNGSPLHLVRRASTSWRNHPLSDSDVTVASRWLLAEEFQMWMTMQPRDCRHALVVHERFASLVPLATRDEHAAALLHDIGKVHSQLGWWMRIVATIVGPRGRRFKLYHDHEALGAEMLLGKSSQRTVDLIAGRALDDVAAALQAADDI